MVSVFNFYRHKVNKLFFFLVFIMFIFIILLFIFKTEKLITVSGNIIAKNKISIKSNITGNIEYIYVKNGDFVKMGTPLFSYSILSIRESINNYINNIDLYIKNKNTILELAYNIIYFQPITAKLIENRMESLSNAIEYYEKMYTDKLHLHNLGFESLDSVNKLRLDLYNFKLEYNNLQLEIKENERKNKYNIEIIRNYGVYDLDFNQIDNIINNIDSDILQYKSKINELEILLNNPVVVSPQDGIINFYESYFYNDVIKNKLQINDLICDIYSDNDFIAKGLLKDIYLPFISVGNKVYINVKAYDYNNYGLILGNISKIYTTPVIINNNVQYYIDITFNPIKYPLFNGLDATINIILSKKETLFFYILNNIILKESKINNNGLFYINRRIMN